MELPNPKSTRIQQLPIISWEEQLQDHNQKIEEYLQNRVFRGCTYESTVRSARAALKRLFDLLIVIVELFFPQDDGWLLYAG